MSETDLAVQELLDRAHISDTVHKYATGIDRRDWALYATVFTDPVFTDFSSFSGEPGKEISNADWVAQVRALQDGFDATHHNSSNHVHEVRGDEATCTSYMIAEHYIKDAPGGEIITLGGYYTNTLVRTEAGWKIRRCQLDITWNRGNMALFELASERAAKLHAEKGIS